MKTPQEAAKEYAKKIWKQGRPYKSPVGYSTDDFLAGVAWAYRWINVEEELPEPGEPYDEKYYSVKCPLFSESGYAFAEFGRDGCWVEDSTGRDITQYVTHWRPIEPVNK